MLAWCLQLELASAYATMHDAAVTSNPQLQKQRQRVDQVRGAPGAPTRSSCAATACAVIGGARAAAALTCGCGPLLLPCGCLPPQVHREPLFTNIANNFKGTLDYIL